MKIEDALNVLIVAVRKANKAPYGAYELEESGLIVEAIKKIMETYNVKADDSKQTPVEEPTKTEIV